MEYIARESKYNFSEECIHIFCEVDKGGFIYSIYAFETQIALIESN